MDESNSLISIIIPNYNNARYLEKTIDSAILASKKYNVEIIFVDDCSSDESVSIAESYGKELAIYKNENNLGQEITTNLGLTYSKGKYAVILHSDDLLSQDFFSVLLPLMENNHNVVMAVGERVEIQNPIGEEYSCLRVSLLPALLKILAENKHYSLPQQIFELGIVVDENYRNQYHLGGVKSSAKANFTESKSLVEAILREVGINNTSITEKDHPAFVEGRCAAVIHQQDGEIGFFGELHPRTITNFSLEHPIIAFEFKVNTLIRAEK